MGVNAYRMLGAVTSACLLLGACGTSGGTDKDTSTSGDASVKASPDGTSTVSVAPDSAATTQVSAYETPASCASLRIDPRAALPGAIVAKCWADALYAHGSMRAFVAGPPDQAAEVVLRPEPQISSKASDGDAVIYVDDTGYSLKEGRWIKGDPKSADDDARSVGAAALLVKSLFTPAGLSQGFAACATWEVDAQRTSVTAHDGAVHADLVRLTCAGAFEVFGAKVSDAALWVKDDWTPIQHLGTASIAGTTITSKQEYSDHGAKFTITAPPEG